MVTVSLPDQSWLDAVGPVEGVTTLVWDPTQPPPEVELDVFVAPYMASPDKIEPIRQQPSVRLVQLLSAGVDAALPVVPDGVELANAHGVHDAATAELAVALVLASQRGFDEFAAAQAKGEWLPREFRPGLADKRVLVLGYGSVGSAIARRLAPFEVELTAVASRARDGDDFVDRIHGTDELLDLLPEHDIVISVLPGTAATKGMLGAETLAALPDGALVVNVGRGPALDTDAALAEAGRLRFALDVTDPEPLPADHPLWSAPGVIISPHVGGVTEAFRPRMVALLREQLRRLAAGEDPLHVVDRG
ncbi:2-hydroxyacid dehydrogenase [Janibacter sp. Soil728]|uniref:2-hydroxyacid dehydrogenase n=1 Tax=Janibacter sp. Soil728 TaxID=1736393 RepID=UPI0012E7DDF4|nr:2-hydroxyacid dehydrogenase [Janibacter sp. Soil728]